MFELGARVQEIRVGRWLFGPIHAGTVPDLFCAYGASCFERKPRRASEYLLYCPESGHRHGPHRAPLHAAANALRPR